MITKFKIFEKDSKEIEYVKKGDYVLMNVKTDNIEYNDFINNTVGKVINIKTKDEGDFFTFNYVPYSIEVEYDLDNMENFKKMKKYFKYYDFGYTEKYYRVSNWFAVSKIVSYDKDKKMVLVKKDSQKYNL